MSDYTAAKSRLRTQFLSLGLGGDVVARRATTSVVAASAGAGRSVHAIGVGRKIVDRQETANLAVRVYVVQKLPLSLLAPRDRIPTSIDGIPTDVIEAEPAFALAKSKTKKKSPARKKSARRKSKSPPKRAKSQARSAPSDGSPDQTPTTCTEHRRDVVRPILGGVSAGHRDVTAGTLGCLCRSRRVGDDQSAIYLLSNNHVFANVNQAMIGEPIYQPAAFDGGMFEHHVANLHRYGIIKLGGTIPNTADAAIGLLLPHIPHVEEICMLGRPAGWVRGEEGMLVRKHGRTTGYTEGKIDDAEYDALVGMDPNDATVVALFQNQLRIVPTSEGPFGLGGDSGSVIVERSGNRIVGLYFAGPSTGAYGVANRMEEVQSELEIEIPA